MAARLPPPQTSPSPRGALAASSADAYAAYRGGEPPRAHTPAAAAAASQHRRRPPKPSASGASLLDGAARWSASIHAHASAALSPSTVRRSGGHGRRGASASRPHQQLPPVQYHTAVAVGTGRHRVACD